MVWVDPLFLLNLRLNGLRHEVVFGDTSLPLLEGSISQDLLSPDNLKLESVGLLLVLSLLLHQLLLPYLLLPFEVHLVDLSLIKPFEMVWLHSVRGKHAHLGLRILSHEIRRVCLVDFHLLLMLPNLMLEDFSLPLLLGQDSVDSIRLLLILGA
jgi:hypothetical protein